MKIKKVLALLLAGALVLSMSACGNTSKDDDDSPTTSNSKTDNDDSSALTDDEFSLIQTANANAKSIYNSSFAFAQKCNTAGRYISTTDDTGTGILVIDNLKGESPRIMNVENGDDSGIKPATITELKIAVDHSPIDNAADTVYYIKFNSKGFPVEVYWAENETTEVVGKYPAPEENKLTKGGIKSLEK